MRLTGSRFGQPGMPVEVLPELAAYRELVATVARELFLRRNPGRQRVPRGFTESFQLRLERVDKGSTIPVLERVSPESVPFSEFDDFFRNLETLYRMQSSASLPRVVYLVTFQITPWPTSLDSGELYEPANLSKLVRLPR